MRFFRGLEARLESIEQKFSKEKDTELNLKTTCDILNEQVEHHRLDLAEITNTITEVVIFR